MYNIEVLSSNNLRLMAFDNFLDKASLAAKNVWEFMDKAAQTAFEKSKEATNFDLRDVFKSVVLDRGPIETIENPDYKRILEKLMKNTGKLSSKPWFANFWQALTEIDGLVEDLILIHDQGASAPISHESNQGVVFYTINSLSDKLFQLRNEDVSHNATRYKITRDEKSNRTVFVEQSEGKLTKFAESPIVDNYPSFQNLMRWLQEQLSLTGYTFHEVQTWNQTIDPVAEAQAMINSPAWTTPTQDKVS